MVEVLDGLGIAVGDLALAGGVGVGGGVVHACTVVDPYRFAVVPTAAVVRAYLTEVSRAFNKGPGPAS
jgi:hypothetical protein